MTVRELIEQLEALGDAESEVVISVGGEYWSHVRDVALRRHGTARKAVVYPDRTMWRLNPVE